MDIRGDHSLKLLELHREFTKLYGRISDARYALVDGNRARQAIPCRVLDNWFDYICGTIDYNSVSKQGEEDAAKETQDRED